jgi:hypothetical protein
VKTIGMDSTGKIVKAGDTVRFRGRHYTVKGFGPSRGPGHWVNVYFEEEVHVGEQPTEVSIDLVEGG